MVPVTRTSVRGHDYPSELQEFAGFHDSSYVNDVTDSVVLSVADHPVTVWIEHADSAHRSQEYGWDPSQPVTDSNQPPSRFVVCALVDGDPKREFSKSPPTLQQILDERLLADGEPLLQTDDPAELVNYLRTLATIERCYYCHAEYGGCTCGWPDDPESSDGFVCRDHWITKPNVSVCGRFYVDPTIYYAPDYATWHASRSKP